MYGVCCVVRLARQRCETESGVYPDEYTKSVNLVTKRTPRRNPQMIFFKPMVMGVRGGQVLTKLFENVPLKNLQLKNRFVRSATYDGLAEPGGYVSDKQVKYFSDLAEGGVGLIIAGIAHVHATGQISNIQNSITGDEFIPGLKRITEEAHKHQVKIAIQLFHAGREAGFARTVLGYVLAPSELEYDPYFKGIVRQISEDEIWEVVSAFGDAAVRAREAGFDGVQVHGAHAYLLSQFLSPFTNRRQDDWGGSLKNRLRLHFEIYKDIRKKVGDDYPIMIKIGIQDGFSGGLEFVEGKRAAQALAELGYDCLEISQGLRGEKYEGTEYRNRIDCLEREAYYRSWCREIKNQVIVPVMMVGGLRTVSLMEEIIENLEADFISLCRPLICEPGLINAWRDDQGYKAKCLSCNNCVRIIKKGRPLSCIQNLEESNDTRFKM